MPSDPVCEARRRIDEGAGKLTSQSTANDIDVCVQQNFPDDSMVQTLRLVTKDRAGDERTLEANTTPGSSATSGLPPGPRGVPLTALGGCR